MLAETQFLDPFKAHYGVNFNAHQGIREFGSSTFTKEKSLPLGRADYTKFPGNISRNQALFDQVDLTLQSRGQYSLQPLLSTQQFLFGSYPFGSAYEPAELSGDHGVPGCA